LSPEYATLSASAPGNTRAVQFGERSRSNPMRDLLVGLAYFIPTALAVGFMLWFLWNLCLQSLSRQTRRRLFSRRNLSPSLQIVDRAAPQSRLRIPLHG